MCGHAYRCVDLDMLDLSSAKIEAGRPRADRYLFIVMACIVMAYIVMAYIVMAYIVMASIVMAYIVMVCLRTFLTAAEAASAHP